jgi:prevent-host-death family protein
MQKINIYEVKTQFSKFVEQAHQGETIVIVKSGKPWAKLVPFEEPQKCFRFDTMQGKIHVSDDFNHPLPDDYNIVKLTFK